MQFLLIRHADAESRAATDYERRLTARGREQAARLGRYLAARHIAPTRIISSPYYRAQETAALVARELTPPPTLNVLAELGCGLTAGALLSLLANLPASPTKNDGDRNDACGAVIAIVGHNPDCAAITGQITGANVDFRKCELAIITMTSPRRGVLSALVPADLQ